MGFEELKKRSKKFAHLCVRFALTLGSDNLSSHVSKQLIRCSTSVAANYRAACVAQSKKQFISNLAKEGEVEYLPKSDIDSLDNLY